MNAVLDRWNKADEADGAARDDCVLRRRAVGRGDGCVAANRKCDGVERGGRSRVGHDGRG